MLTEYDEAGNYKYPDGFNPETNEWKEGFESQREKWSSGLRCGPRSLGSATRSRSRPGGRDHDAPVAVEASFE
jgi:hypothetical protein